MNYLTAIVGLISTLSLVSLCTYIYLAWKGGSLTLSFTLDQLSWGQRTFRVLAALGLLTCLYKGSEAMLFWIPNSWGSYDESGYFSTFKSSLAFLVTLIGGIGGIFVIGHATKDAFSYKRVQAKADGLESIFETINSGDSLEPLRERFERVIAHLESEAQLRGPVARSLYSFWLPENQTIKMYRGLIETVGRFQARR